MSETALFERVGEHYCFSSRIFDCGILWTKSYLLMFRQSYIYWWIFTVLIFLWNALTPSNCVYSVNLFCIYNILMDALFSSCNFKLFRSSIFKSPWNFIHLSTWQWRFICSCSNYLLLTGKLDRFSFSSTHHSRVKPL